jgi:hypothetical protein
MNTHQELSYIFACRAQTSATFPILLGVSVFRGRRPRRVGQTFVSAIESLSGFGGADAVRQQRLLDPRYRGLRVRVEL